MRSTFYIAVMFLVLMVSSKAFAQPDLSIKSNTALLLQSLPDYRFEILEMSSAQQKYRVYLAVPKKEAPSHGYPVIYMLDGNAVLDYLNEKRLAEIAASNPPVLVMIGYQTDKRFDVVARAYDYTPPVSEKTVDEDVPGSGRQGGGADYFLRFIEQQLKPAVNQQVMIDQTKQALWGHSYGGLFVLHVLFTSSDSFQKYWAISPSLWWQKGAILDEEKYFSGKKLSQSIQLIVMTGSDENKKRTRQNSDNDKVKERQRLRAELPKDSLQKMVERLNAKNNLVVNMYTLEGMTHGAMLDASVMPAIQTFSEKHQ